jgi:hypothetical protein
LIVVFGLAASAVGALRERADCELAGAAQAYIMREVTKVFLGAAAVTANGTLR